MNDPIDTNTMRSLVEAANSITNPTTLVRHTWLTEEEVEEAIAEATKGVGNRPMTGVPAGASREDHEKARKANPFRVGLSKGVPAGAGAKTWSGKTTKLNKFGNHAVVAADENGSALSWANRTQAQNFSDRHNLNGVVEPSAMGRSFYVSVSDISEATRGVAATRAVTNRKNAGKVTPRGVDLAKYHDKAAPAEADFEAAKAAYTAAYKAAEDAELAAYKAASDTRINALEAANEKRQAATDAADKALDEAKAALAAAMKSAHAYSRMR